MLPPGDRHARSLGEKKANVKKEAASSEPLAAGEQRRRILRKKRANTIRIFTAMPALVLADRARSQ
jgi:hypothetical protein